MYPFYTTRKYQKTKGFLVFSGDINENIDQKWVNQIAWSEKGLENRTDRGKHKYIFFCGKKAIFPLPKVNAE